ncbi:MAG: hypothetical protein RL208_239 [Pseudomonadota bacterium]|jgi:cell division protein FtsZ
MNNSVLNVNNFIPKIVVFGVGGAGLNALNNMILSKLEDVTFVAANTDCQSLNYSLAEHKVQLGINCTRGLGAGAMPEVGKKAAEEAVNEIRSHLQDADLVFIAAGMGGGTGTGAGPVIAKIAKEMGILTVGVVTTPFSFEGKRRQIIADEGINIFEQNVDTLIIVANQNLLALATPETSFAESFKMADDVLYNAVKCVVELLTKPGFINRDFADLKTVMSSMGRAVIGYGECSSESQNRHIVAAEAATNNPILANGSIKGATSVLINISGGADMKIFEVESIVDYIQSFVADDVNILFGTSFDGSLEGKIRVSVVATGMKNAQEGKNQPQNTISNEKNNVLFAFNNTSNAKQTTQAVEKPVVQMQEVSQPVQPKIAKPVANPSFNADKFNEDEIDTKDSVSFETFSLPHSEDVKNEIKNASSGFSFFGSFKNDDVKKKTNLTPEAPSGLPFGTKVNSFKDKIAALTNNIKSDALSVAQQSTTKITKADPMDIENEIQDIWSTPAISRVVA